MKLRTPAETSQLLIEKAPWDAIDSEYESRIPSDEPSENANLLSRMVARGEATLHRLVFDGRRVGMLITRVDVGSAGRELVVVAVYGRLHSRPLSPLSPLLVESVEALARAENCCVIRFHTVRPTLARFACENVGYRISEIVLRKDVT